MLFATPLLMLPRHMPRHDAFSFFRDFVYFAALRAVIAFFYYGDIDFLSFR